MSKPGQRLDLAIGYLTDLRPIYTHRLDTLKLLAEVLRSTDYDGSTRTGLGDPTPSLAADDQHRIRLQNIEHNEVLLLHHAKMLWALVNGIRSDIDTEAIVRQHQCRGGKLSAVDPDDPAEVWRIEGLCSEIIGKADLCPRCYKRWWRFNNPKINA